MAPIDRGRRLFRGWIVGSHFLVDGEFGGGIGRPFEEGQVHGTMDHHERRRVGSSRVVPRRGLFILASLSHTHCCFLSSH